MRVVLVLGNRKGLVNFGCIHWVSFGWSRSLRVLLVVDSFGYRLGLFHRLGRLHGLVVEVLLVGGRGQVRILQDVLFALCEIAEACVLEVGRAGVGLVLAFETFVVEADRSSGGDVAGRGFHPNLHLVAGREEWLIWTVVVLVQVHPSGHLLTFCFLFVAGVVHVYFPSEVAVGIALES